MFNRPPKFEVPKAGIENKMTESMDQFIQEWAPNDQRLAIEDNLNEEDQFFRYVVVEDILTEMNDERRNTYMETTDPDVRQALYNQQLLENYAHPELRQAYEEARKHGNHQQLADDYALYFEGHTGEQQMGWTMTHERERARAFAEYLEDLDTIGDPEEFLLELDGDSTVYSSDHHPSTISELSESDRGSDIPEDDSTVYTIEENAPTISEPNFSETSSEFHGDRLEFTESELAPSEDFSDMTGNDFAPSETSSEPSVQPIGEEHGLDLGEELSDVSDQQLEEDGWFNDEYDPELDELPEIPDVPQHQRNISVNMNEEIGDMPESVVDEHRQRQRNESIDLGDNPLTHPQPPQSVRPNLDGIRHERNVSIDLEDRNPPPRQPYEPPVLDNLDESLDESVQLPQNLEIDVDEEMLLQPPPNRPQVDRNNPPPQINNESVSVDSQVLEEKQKRASQRSTRRKVVNERIDRRKRLEQKQKEWQKKREERRNKKPERGRRVGNINAFDDEIHSEKQRRTGNKSGPDLN